MVASDARAPIGLGLPVVLRVFALLAARAPFATRFAGFLRVVPALLRAALPTGGFLRVVLDLVLALPLTFFFVLPFAIAISLTLTALLEQ